MTSKITILGSGTMMPTKERNPAGFLFELDKTRILLDCGHGIIRRMVDYGIDPQSIDAVFISHFHTDHFTDAFPLVHARWINELGSKYPSNPLLFLGPKELKKRYLLWRKVFWPEPKEHYPIDFKEGPLNLRIGNLQIETFDVKHVPWFSSVGIKIKYDNKLIVYTGDIGSRHNFNALIAQTKNANLLMIEAGTEKPSPNHFTFEQVKELFQKANIDRVLIVHIPVHRVQKLEELVSQNPKFELGKDGKVIEI